MIQRVRQQWNRLSRQKQMGFMLLAVVATGLFTYLRILEPWTQQAGKTAAERKTLQQQISKLRESLAAFDNERQQLQQQREAILGRREELGRLERQMVSAEDLGQLVGELARQGEGLSIAFESITQDVNTGEERPEVTIDLAFSASFNSAVNYLRRIEHLSPYLAVTKLEIGEAKEAQQGDTQSIVATLTSPLRNTPGGGQFHTDPKMLPSPVKISRSPFRIESKRNKEISKEEYRLTGITWRGPSSTAIINDEVMRVGDHVREMRITQILPNSVILSDGTETLTLPLAQ